VHLCADETVVVTIEPRTGKIGLRDTGDLGAAGRGPRFLAISEKVNESPTALLSGLTRLRVNVCSAFTPDSMRIYVPLDDCRVSGTESKLSGLSDVQAAEFFARG